MPKQGARPQWLGLIGGLTVVGLWSLAPLLVGVTTREVYDWKSLVFWVWALMLVGSALFLFLGGKWSAYCEEIRNVDRRSWLLLGVLGASLLAYYICWFYALTHVSLLHASVLNYLWPMFLLLLAPAIAMPKRQRVQSLEWIFVIAAFLGALLMLLGDRPLNRLFEVEFQPGHLAALGGALMAGFMFNLAPRIRHDKVFSTVGGVYVTALALVAPAAILLAILDPKTASLAWPETPLLLLYGLVICGMGHLIWVYSLERYPSQGLAALVYCVPVLALLWVALFFPDESRFVRSAVVGACLVVVPNLVLHSPYRQANASTASFIGGLVCGLLCLPDSPIDAASRNLGMVGTFSAVFGLVVAFGLNRMAGNNRGQSTALAKISAELTSLLSSLQGSVSSQKLESVRDAADRLLQSMVEFDFAAATRSYEDQVAAVHEAMNPLRRLEESLSNDDLRPEIRRTVTVLMESVDQWLALREERLSKGETFSVWAMGLLGIMTFILNRPDAVVGDISAVAYSSAIIFLLFSLRDFDLSRPNRSLGRILITQRPFHRIGREYYLPAHVVTAGSLPRPAKPLDFRYQDDAGEMQTHRVMPQELFATWILRVFFWAAGLVVLGLLISKHAHLDWLG